MFVFITYLVIVLIFISLFVLYFLRRESDILLAPVARIMQIAQLVKRGHVCRNDENNTGHAAYESKEKKTWSAAVLFLSDNQ